MVMLLEALESYGVQRETFRGKNAKKLALSFPCSTDSQNE